MAAAARAPSAGRSGQPGLFAAWAATRSGASCHSAPAPGRTALTDAASPGLLSAEGMATRRMLSSGPMVTLWHGGISTHSAASNACSEGRAAAAEAGPHGSAPAAWAAGPGAAMENVSRSDAMTAHWRLRSAVSMRKAPGGPPSSGAHLLPVARYREAAGALPSTCRVADTVRPSVTAKLSRLGLASGSTPAAASSASSANTVRSRQPCTTSAVAGAASGCTLASSVRKRAKQNSESELPRTPSSASSLSRATTRRRTAPPQLPTPPLCMKVH
mmetsp:Transcript_14318/g.54220  ORF Transcript_14318/g.54220 Transcript_14318/m.54220 type:complete len:273 (-) Transcript_14318:594-1412(-)